MCSKPTSILAPCRGLLLFFLLVWTLDQPGLSQDAKSLVSASDHTQMAGHSIYGEAFNEGPRQHAYLMDGMGNVHFSVTADDDLVQRFIDQGVAQLYGFWYYEAERSFRQAAALDPLCAMSYWGMALANVNNLERSRQFIAQAVKLRDNCTPREQLYIDAWDKFATETDKDGKKIARKDRAQAYTAALEKITMKYPDDVEAKALLALQLWENDRSELPIVSQVAVNALLSEVFAANPMHPAHHFRIHLWDKQDSEMALESAGLAGPSLPGIAHMWHMPGHTYSKLHRYQDAVWQQEASARVDHAHMMRDRVMPDQIHNFAHNNEWLIRNLVKIGRVKDAIDLAKNMLELPRHPRYNTLERGSTKLGRERLLLVLNSYRLWPELIELGSTMYLEPTSQPELQIERLRVLAVAHAMLGQSDAAKVLRSELQQRQETAKAELTKSESTKKDLEDLQKAEPGNAANQAKSADNSGTSGDQLKAANNRKRKLEDIEKQIKSAKELSQKCDQALAAIDAASAASAKDWTTALKRFDEAGDWDKLLKVEWLAESGDMAKAMELIDKEISSLPGEILPLATKCWIHLNAHQVDACKETFMQLRKLASMAELTTPVLARLGPMAVAFGYGENWAEAYVDAKDIGPRPNLENLGPFRWSPYVAPTPVVLASDGKELPFSELRGKPTIVFFYLGFGCLHCIEQLHAFSPRAADFRQQGIQLMAISSETIEKLQAGIANYEKAINIPLHSDAELLAFREFRCYDDFERKPLHGTFLIDGVGRVVWQDIGHEPFKDVEFLLNESKRLLELNGAGQLQGFANQAK